MHARAHACAFASSLRGAQFDARATRSSWELARSPLPVAESRTPLKALSVRLVAGAHRIWPENESA